MNSQQNIFKDLLHKIQILREEGMIRNIIIKILLLSKSQRHNEQNLSYKTTNDNFPGKNFGQFKNRFKNDNPKRSS